MSLGVFCGGFGTSGGVQLAVDHGHWNGKRIGVAMDGFCAKKTRCVLNRSLPRVGTYVL